MQLTGKLCGVIQGVRRKKRFLDSLRIYVKGGAGGMGFPKVGGLGGTGGDIYVVGKQNASLKNIINKYPSKRIIAGNGENSHNRRFFGHKGDDVTIQVPLGIVLYNNAGVKLGELNVEGDKYRVVQGGIGGRPENGFSGMKGESQVITLDLKLIADIGLVGFPNAGKSTLLSKLSNVRPKIASYPFTTIQPQLGMIQYNDLRQISVADLPGLIEGAHENFGMGHKFLKHVERTKLLLVVVDVEGFRLSPMYPHRSCLETLLLLNKELELYREELLSFPSMLVVNKMDTNGAQAIYDHLCSTLNNLKDLDDIPESMRPNIPFNFNKVIGISAKNGDIKEIDQLKSYIRDILDEDIENDMLSREISVLGDLNIKLKETGSNIV